LEAIVACLDEHRGPSRHPRP